MTKLDMSLKQCINVKAIMDLKNEGFCFYSKPVLSGHSERRPKIGFQDWLSLNALSILQYFRSSLSYQ